MHAPTRTVDSSSASTGSVPDVIRNRGKVRVEALTGTGPDGAPVRLDVSQGQWTVYLLTSSCRPCRDVWPTLGAGDVAITPGPATESRRKVSALAPDGVVVVMSSEAWFELEPGPAPWRVELRDGEVSLSGPAGTHRVDLPDDV